MQGSKYATKDPIGGIAVGSHAHLRRVPDEAKTLVENAMEGAL